MQKSIPELAISIELPQNLRFGMFVFQRSQKFFEKMSFNQKFDFPRLIAFCVKKLGHSNL